MAITKADVLARFAEFTAIGDPEWTAVLADALLSVNATVWGSKADLGQIYLAAHKLGSAHPSLVPAGRITREAMDGTDYSYAVGQPMPSDDQLDSTPYGRLFLALRKQLARARWAIT